MSVELSEQTRKYLKKKLVNIYAVRGREVIAEESLRVDETLTLVEALYGTDLEEQGFVLPLANAGKARLAEMFYEERFLGKTFRMFSPSCPDYSYHFDPLQGKNVYDFKTINKGISLIGTTLLQKASLFIEILRKVGIRDLSYTILIADIEADDREILGSVGLDREQFLDRIKGTELLVRAEAEKMLRGYVSVGVMSSLLKPEDYSRARYHLDQMKPSRLYGISVNRANLYSRWFGKVSVVSENDFAGHRAREDALKSLAFGSAVRREGVLVLDATDPLLASLYNYGDGLKPSPLVMIKNSY